MGFWGGGSNSRFSPKVIGLGAPKCAKAAETVGRLVVLAFGAGGVAWAEATKKPHPSLLTNAVRSIKGSVIIDGGA